MKFLMLVLLAFITGSVEAQLAGQELIDSIISVLPSLPDDTTKVGLYGKLIALQYSRSTRKRVSPAQKKV